MIEQQFSASFNGEAMHRHLDTRAQEHSGRMALGLSCSRQTTKVAHQKAFGIGAMADEAGCKPVLAYHVQLY